MFEKSFENIRQEYVGKMLSTVQEIKKKVDEKTPEDTRKLLQNNDTSVSIEASKVIGEVFNDKTEYAKYVEYGVRSKPYNYHKPKGSVFYQGVGARMFTRTLDNDVPDILKKLK